ncbi:hypothetical protein MTBBW1_1270004 [Desulfamplus magnetovallimortis]|uniref:Uncharacterized protein n=1 Tax=Desulfamplus magnetovallimortis TaxID=1246637 RepID=A0A1W1H6T9_9BACT|nr:hypothetical protein MTBBW1_1270004 [Desulfamplus magnetovallimortis]
MCLLITQIRNFIAFLHLRNLSEPGGVTKIKRMFRINIILPSPVNLGTPDSESVDTTHRIIGVDFE